MRKSAALCLGFMMGLTVMIGARDAFCSPQNQTDLAKSFKEAKLKVKPSAGAVTSNVQQAVDALNRIEALDNPCEGDKRSDACTRYFAAYLQNLGYLTARVQIAAQLLDRLHVAELKQVVLNYKDLVDRLGNSNKLELSDENEKRLTKQEADIYSKCKEKLLAAKSHIDDTFDSLSKYKN